MIKIIWDNKFKKIYKKWSKKHPNLINSFANRMEVFEKDPFHPSLKTHSLSGVLKELWASSITYEERVVFKFMDKEKKEVLLIDIGGHEEVY